MEIRTGTVFSIRIRQAYIIKSRSISLGRTWGRAPKLIHGVLGPKSHVSGNVRAAMRVSCPVSSTEASCPADDEQVGAPHPEQCPGVLARAVSRLPPFYASQGAVCGTEEFIHEFIHEFIRLRCHKLQTHCSMMSLPSIGQSRGAPCRFATTARLTAPAWNLTRHSVPHTG
jgi:hypothetical protein